MTFHYSGKMVKLSIFTLIICIFICYSTAYANDPKDEIYQLLQEYKQIKREKSYIDNEMPKLAEIKKRLEMDQYDFENEIAPYKQKLAQKKAEANKFDAQVNHYNEICAGRPLTPPEKARCDQLKARLLSWRSQLESYLPGLQHQSDMFEKREKELELRHAGFINQTNELAARKQHVDERHIKWKMRVLEFRNSKTFQRLKGMASLSKACSKIPGIGSFEKNLNGASENAVFGLQMIWDNVYEPNPNSPPQTTDNLNPPRPTMREVPR